MGSSPSYSPRSSAARDAPRPEAAAASNSVRFEPRGPAVFRVASTAWTFFSLPQTHSPKVAALTSRRNVSQASGSASSATTQNDARLPEELARRREVLRSCAAFGRPQTQVPKTSAATSTV